MTRRSPFAQPAFLVVAALAIASLPVTARDDVPDFGSLSADGLWEPLPTPPRGGHTIVRDPARDRLILFGGSDPVRRGDLWWMPCDQSSGWSLLQASGLGPTGRERHVAVFDALRDRMLVFGGDSGLVSNELWSLSFSGMPTWQPITPLGTPPSPRSRHAAVYDPLRDRLLVFGGFDGTGALDDVWELSLSGVPSWNPVETSGSPPAARYSHAMIYDPVRDRLVVHGGQIDEESPVLTDVATLDLSGTPTWSSINAQGSVPQEMARHRAAYNPLHDSMVILGFFGFHELSFTPTPTWTEHPGPTEVRLGFGDFGTCVDESRQRLIVMGGRDAFLQRYNQTWSIDFSDLSWSAAAPEAPAAMFWHTLIYDSMRRNLVLYGGMDGQGDPSDAWTLPLGGSRSWSRITGAGSGPGLRVHHAAIFAPSRGTMVVFGGDSPPGTSTVWELDFDAPLWSQIATIGTPPDPRHLHTAIHDAARDRMVVFGGSANGTPVNQVWALTLSGTPTWSQITPAGTPPSPRWDHAAVYDPVGDRMIVFGGRTGSSTITNQVWSLAFTPTPTWTQLVPSGTGPVISEGAAAAYDPARRRMIVFGNQANHSSFFALDLAGPPTWTKLAPANRGPAGRFQSAMTFDVEGDRLALYGGAFNTAFEYEAFGDGWTLAFGDPVGVPTPAKPVAIELAPPIPNPAHRASTIRFTLPRAMHGTLSIRDLAGRRVRLLRASDLTAGSHTVEWDLTNDAGDRVAAGVYWYEWSSTSGRAGRRIVVLD